MVTASKSTIVSRMEVTIGRAVQNDTPAWWPFLFHCEMSLGLFLDAHKIDFPFEKLSLRFEKLPNPAQRILFEKSMIVADWWHVTTRGIPF
jgi:hypothetical protein